MGCGSSSPVEGGATSSGNTSSGGGGGGAKQREVPAEEKYGTAPPPSLADPSSISDFGHKKGSSQFRDPNAAFQSFLVRDKEKAAAITPTNMTTNKGPDNEVILWLGGTSSLARTYFVNYDKIGKNDDDNSSRSVVETEQREYRLGNLNDQPRPDQVGGSYPK